MTITKTRVTCSDCKHVSDVDMVTDAPISVAIASMEAARCPECGSGNLGFGGEKSEGKPGPTASIEVRAAWWRENGDTGMSSITIFNVFCGGVNSRPSIPYDPADYGRCRKLLDLIPEWRADFGRMTTAFAWWRPFVDNWDEMDALWDAESPSGRCPKLYALLKQCEKRSDVIPPAGGRHE